MLVAFGVARLPLRGLRLRSSRCGEIQLPHSCLKRPQGLSLASQPFGRQGPSSPHLATPQHSAQSHETLTRLSSMSAELSVLVSHTMQATEVHSGDAFTYSSQEVHRRLQLLNGLSASVVKFWGVD